MSYQVYSVDTVTLTRTAPGPWQEPGAKSTVSLRARVTEKTERVLNPEGIEVEATHQILIGYAELRRVFNNVIDIYFDDIITYNGQKFSILKIGKDKDFSPRAWIVSVR